MKHYDHSSPGLADRQRALATHGPVARTLAAQPSVLSRPTSPAGPARRADLPCRRGVALPLVILLAYLVALWLLLDVAIRVF